MIGLRRRPAGLSVNHQGGGAGMFEIICRTCGDDPALDYRQVSAEFRQVRGCYPLRIGLVLFFQHQEFHDRAGRRSGVGAGRGGRQVADRPSRECLEEPPAVTLVLVASLLEELVRLQKQTAELLREMAHTQENAAIQRQGIAREPARLLASVPAQPRPDKGQSEQAVDPGPRPGSRSH
ncbi:MAG: hypothetical protein WAL13_12815 [Trebonia sp.]